MNLAPLPGAPRDNNLRRPPPPHQQVFIDLTADSEPNLDRAPPPSRNQLQPLNNSGFDLESQGDELFVPAPRRPPPPQRRHAQRQILIVDSPSPEPQVALRRPAQSPARYPELDPSSSADFRRHRPVRPESGFVPRPARLVRPAGPAPDLSSSPNRQESGPFRPASAKYARIELSPDRVPSRHQNPFYGSDSDADMDSSDMASPNSNPQQAPDLGGGLRAPRGMMGDYILDEEFDDALLHQYIGGFPQAELEWGQHDQGFGMNAPPQAYPVEGMVIESKNQCFENLSAIFPGICEEYVAEIYENKSKTTDALVAHVLDQVEKGIAYPNVRDKQRLLKRKRVLDEDEEAIRKYGALDRVIPAVGPAQIIRGYIKNILTQEFADVPMHFIEATLSQSGYRLFSAYRVLEEAQRTFEHDAPTYQRLKRARKTVDFKDECIPKLMAEASQPEKEILEELLAARRMRRNAGQKRLEILQAELKEEENTRKAEAEGTMSECGCCMGDYPMNRMVHCDNEEIHWFCRGCALKTAETEIENTRYEIKCMSMDGCEGGFSLEQRLQFLDAKTMVALERNEQESNLRLAGIENLASCPFCPYAAEYPPISENHQFHCKRPECEQISCRLCKLESHIPKSCEEYAKENGLSIRRQIEEAMSAALIRKCNKCQTPFIKEEGCNKMTCTRPGCHNIQCYVCSKSCGYDHFNDVSRGGKPENCPLFESVEVRHDQEVKDAERAAMEKIRADHPEYSEEDLRVKMSDEVQKDDEKRKARNPHQARVAAVMVNGRMPDGALPPAEHLGIRAAILREARHYRPHPQGHGDPPMMVNDNSDPYGDGDDVLRMFDVDGRFAGRPRFGPGIPAHPQVAMLNNQAGNAPMVAPQMSIFGRRAAAQLQPRAQAQAPANPGVRARIRAALNPPPAPAQPQNPVIPRARGEAVQQEDRGRLLQRHLDEMRDRIVDDQARAQDVARLIRRRRYEQVVNQPNPHAIPRLQQADRMNDQNAAAQVLLDVMHADEIPAQAAAQEPVVAMRVEEIRAQAAAREQAHAMRIRDVRARANANVRHVPMNTLHAFHANPPQAAGPNIQRDAFPGEALGMLDRELDLLDHAERRIQRRQELARIRREAADDEAELALRLARGRQNNAAVAAAQLNVWKDVRRPLRANEEEDEVLNTDGDEDEDEDELIYMDGDEDED